MKLGVTETIDCAHHLPGHPKCGTHHGHTYKVEFVIEGDHDGGMMMDFADIKDKLREVLMRYDHEDWNDHLEYPTVENICMLLHDELEEQFDFEYTLRVYEGEGKWAEV